MNILLASGGRRVALLKAWRRALEQLGLAGRSAIVVADMSELSAAYQLADHAETVPRVTDPGYVDRLLEICDRYDVGMVVPLIDPELPVLAGARERFLAEGIIPVISDPATIAISNDKRVTERFFRENGIATPAQLDAERALAGEYAFPMFIKPLNGSSSIGSRAINDLEELRFWLPRTHEPLLLELAGGVEYTVDVYAGLDGRVHCAVPRRRVQVRAGEVEKGRTEAIEEIMDTAMRAARALPGGRGVLTFQCLLPDDGPPSVFELNARFGGGAPLSIEAGADFPRWLIEEALGREPSVATPPFEDGVLMLRWDDAVFIRERA